MMRPDALEDMSYYVFNMAFRKEKQDSKFQASPATGSDVPAQPDNRQRSVRLAFQPAHPQAQTHMVKSREQPAVPHLIGQSLARPADTAPADVKERYAAWALGLFVPFRPNSSIAPHTSLWRKFTAWESQPEQTYSHEVATQVLTNITQYVEAQQDARSAVKMRRKHLRLGAALRGDSGECRSDCSDMSDSDDSISHDRPDCIAELDAQLTGMDPAAFDAMLAALTPPDAAVPTPDHDQHAACSDAYLAGPLSLLRDVTPQSTAVHVPAPRTAVCKARDTKSHASLLRAVGRQLSAMQQVAQNSSSTADLDTQARQPQAYPPRLDVVMLDATGQPIGDTQVTGWGQGWDSGQGTASSEVKGRVSGLQQALSKHAPACLWYGPKDKLWR